MVRLCLSVAHRTSAFRHSSQAYLGPGILTSDHNDLVAIMGFRSQQLLLHSL